MAARTKDTRRKVGIICMVLGIVLLGAALALLLYNRKEDSNGGTASASALAELQEQIDDGDGSLELDGNTYIGYLTIPALSLQLPVMSEWTYDRLLIAPCRYFGSVDTNDLVICAHNYTSHFGMLKDLQAGDDVLFTDTEGATTSYKVAALEVLQPTQIAEMIASDYDLTLYTCTYGGASRVTVRCNRSNATS